MTEQADRPILVFPDRTDEEKQITLYSDSVTLGRGEECDIVLNERQVSRTHIRLYKEGDAFFVDDLDSKNGTWVNGVQLKGTRRLTDGDEINLALAIKIQFIGSGATAPLPFELPASLSAGRLRLDLDARRVFINDAEIDPPLSPPQYRLLEMLYMSPGKISTREQVISTVWPDVLGDGVSEQAIDALVRRLRDRLSEIDPDWQYIITVRGHGFRLNNSPEV
ncbi:MAG: FHA domain-containing protein [Chloroflexota bacterium]|nr:FHA domain-containing protein [Chloroflexota bacterium]